MDNQIKPYLQKYPRIPDNNTKHDERYDPRTYVSIQSKVNNDPEFEQKYINKIVSDGWVALQNITDIFMYPKGKTFKYRLNGESMSGEESGTFRSGGWLVGKNENYDEEDSDGNYILYKGFNGAIFSLQIKDILELYIKSPKKDKVVFKKPYIRTNFPVYLQNKKGRDEVVYYASDNAHKTRFINSKKYIKALSTGNWSWSMVFED